MPIVTCCLGGCFSPLMETISVELWAPAPHRPSIHPFRQSNDATVEQSAPPGAAARAQHQPQRSHAHGGHGGDVVGSNATPCEPPVPREGRDELCRCSFGCLDQRWYFRMFKTVFRFKMAKTCQDTRRGVYSHWK